MFLLNDFESAVPEVILSRGLSYFKNRAVVSLDETEAGLWQAVVSGSEDYEVDITLDGKQVTSWTCDCPYEEGPICKHVVAVLYALRDAAPAQAKKRKSKTTKMGFEDILLKLSKEELRAYIRHQKTLDREFGERFMLFFSDKDPQMDVEKKYREMVQQLRRKHSNRGFMDYRSTYAFSKAMMPVLQAADHAESKNNFREALAIAQVVCLEVMDTIQHCDDSSGVVGDTLQDGIQVFHVIADNPAVAPEVRDQIFAWLEKNLQDSIWFDYGNFGYELLDVAEMLAPKVDPDRYLGLLDKLQKLREAAGTFGEHRRKQFLIRKIRLLQAIGREKEVEQLIAANMDIEDVRLGEVEKAMAQKDFTKAKQLIAGGIDLAVSNEHSGLIRRWEEVLLRIAQLENDTTAIRFFAKKFAFDRGLRSEYYQQWKSTFSPEEWATVIEQHIQSVIAEETAKPRKFAWESLEFSLFSSLAPIYIAEGQWERLLHVLPANPGEHSLSVVHPHLAKRYPKEMLGFYLPVLEKTANQANSRSQYQQLVALMKKIKKDIEASRTAIDELAASLMLKYPRRPAMKEELAKVLKAGR